MKGDRKPRGESGCLKLTNLKLKTPPPLPPPQQPVFENAANGTDTVFPVDLFAFGISMTVVGDAHLKASKNDARC